MRQAVVAMPVALALLFGVFCGVATLCGKYGEATGMGVLAAAAAFVALCQADEWGAKK